MSSQRTGSTAACPRCGADVVSHRGSAPWCSSCEWNLDYFRDQPPRFGWRWLDRWERRLAFRLSKREFARLAGKPVGRGGSGPLRVFLIVLAAVMLAGQIGLLAAGIYLISYRFPSLLMVPGAVLVLLALALRPRVGRIAHDAIPLSRDQAPALFKLIDDVVHATGSRAPHIVAVDFDLNAYTTVVGVRRRRVLCLGLPLWAVLEPQERVALVGHELGHFVNGDVRRGAVTRIPDDTLAGLADALNPGWAASTGESSVAFFERLVGAVFAVIRHGLELMRVGLLAALHRDGQRAEYLADQIAARVAGTRAATGLMDQLVNGEVTWMLVCREARAGHLADGWRTVVGQARFDRLSRARQLRQLSIREQVSLFASHPPNGMRASMLESRPPVTATVVLSGFDSERIDAELTPLYQRARRELALA